MEMKQSQNTTENENIEHNNRRSNKRLISIVLMITAAFLCVFTVHECTKKIPPEHYLGKVWVMDYSEWGDFIAVNQTVSFSITELDDGNVTGYFTTGQLYGTIDDENTWETYGRFYGEIEDGTALCHFVREPNNNFSETVVDLYAKLTFETDGRIGISFNPTGENSKLFFHEDYELYRICELKDLEHVAPYLDGGEYFHIETGFGEADFIFVTMTDEDIYLHFLEDVGKLHSAVFLISKEQELFLSFDYHRAFSRFTDVKVEDRNGDGMDDIVIIGIIYMAHRAFGSSEVPVNFVYYNWGGGMFVPEE